MKHAAIRITACAALLAFASLCSAGGEKGDCEKAGGCGGKDKDDVVDVTTYHYDAMRTGWNPKETVLTPAAVKSKRFGLLHKVSLDEQVDAQPLLVHGIRIGGEKHEVVYVATERNTVYAIDAVSGAVLLSRQLGQPVEAKSLPKGPYTDAPPWGPCNNNSDVVGINSTPVIDLETGTLYVVTYNLGPLDEGKGAPGARKEPMYHLHALDLASLDEKKSFNSPVEIRASVRGPKANSKSIDFDPAALRQRSALLHSKGNVYIAFASFCDHSANKARGWLLGWEAKTLKPLKDVQLDDRIDPSNPPANDCNTSPSSGALPCYLSSIWMSGSGPAADKEGNIFVATGNSAAGSYAKPGAPSPYNMDDSLLKFPPDLAKISEFFTPNGKPEQVSGGGTAAPGHSLDADLGSGGVMLLPDQGSPALHLAVAAGKEGRMYLVDRDHLGGQAGGTPAASTTISGKTVPAPVIDDCHCAESYFRGSDGFGRVVSSGDSGLTIWKVSTSPPALSKESAPGVPVISGVVQDHSFFTSVSSNESAAGSAIVWAVRRPVMELQHSSNPKTPPWMAPVVTLFAIDPAGSGPAAMLSQLSAGVWKKLGGNANIVPVVANGKVYVATYKQLAIFGLEAPAGASKAVDPDDLESAAQLHRIYGTLTQVHGTRLVVKSRSGKLIDVDAAAAARRKIDLKAQVGATVQLIGTEGPSGVFSADRIFPVEANPQGWPADL